MFFFLCYIIVKLDGVILNLHTKTLFFFLNLVKLFAKKSQTHFYSYLSRNMNIEYHKKNCIAVIW